MEGEPPKLEIIEVINIQVISILMLLLLNIPTSSKITANHRRDQTEPCKRILVCF